MARPATFPISVDWLPGGDLLVVSGHTLHGRRPDGDLVPRTDLSGLSELPWNEIVVDDRGNTFVNNVGFDLLSGAEAAPGLIAVVTGDGAPRKVAGDVWFPNGMAVAAPAPRAGHP
jgi:sugar lactone lactonase YvrE